MSERTDAALDLGSLIQSTPYQSIPVGPRQGDQSGNPDGVPQGTDSPPGVGQNEGLSPVAPNTQQSTDGATGQDGVTTQPSQGSTGNEQFESPEVRALREQLQAATQTIQNQTRFIQTEAQRRAQAEETEFRRQLDAMEPEEREAAIAKRDRDRLAAELSYRQGQDNLRRQQEQLQAKSLVATLVAQEHGLPPAAKTHLLRARSEQDMQNIARDLVNSGYGRQQVQQTQVQQQAPQYQQQQVQPQYTQNPAHLAGDVSASSDITPEFDKWGSGDLMSYIQSQDWQVIPVED